MYGYIYKFTFLPNGKIYIGKKKNTRNLELIDSYWGSGKIWRWKLNNYPKSEWKHLVKREILEWCATEVDLADREKYWISQYDSTDKDIGYNLSRGGINPVLYGSNNGMYGRKRSEEERANIRSGISNRDFWGKNNPSSRDDVREKLHYIALENGSNITLEGRKSISDFVKSIVYITNGKCNLQSKKDKVDYYKSLGLGYDLGITKGIDNKNFIMITDGNVNHKIPEDELHVWIQDGWIRGDRRKEASQRRLREKAAND